MTCFFLGFGLRKLKWKFNYNVLFWGFGDAGSFEIGIGVLTWM